MTATITDNVGVASASVYYDDGSGSKNAAMTGSGSTYTGSIGKFTAGKTVQYFVQAKDAAGNTANSTKGSFSVTAGGDKQAPLISSVQNSPTSPKDTDQVTISATITDNVGVTSATAYYNDGSGLQNKVMTGSGSSYSTIIGTFAAGKTVSYYVEAKDAANNVAKSPSGSFTVQGTQDTQKPVITSVAHAPPSPTPSDDVTVSATITDNVGVKTAEVKYDDGSGVKTATMTASGSTFSSNIGKFAPGASVTYHVEAKDAAANLEKSADGTFTVATSSQLPDVTVTSVQTSPSSPKIGDKVTITATVQNVGTGDASNVNVAFSIAGAVIDTKVVPSIVAGGSSTVQASWTAQTEGSKDLKVVATASGDNNPANDAKSSTFTVSKGGGGNGGTGTAGSNVILWILPIIVVIVVVVVLLMLFMRRKKPAQQSFYQQQDMFGGGPQW